ncbi:alpha-L-arabinofuranosidase C-terminal domain-containing protein [Segetibacter koreensis]|uniref:alpha-L-arabinofuranosidase C-terminal domain-containing protein n=1 Tax=Segetibacter koreensis TaxID=398037 RepID=UPI00037DBC61|nr:alpha-L-arabinofuranosidase C-terminal domain-containing protein [Segetibacter koreensis]
MKKGFIICIITACIIAGNSYAQQSIVVKVDAVKSKIQPTMWGIFFEDINLGADGGIYAELVKNRSFEFATPLMGWKLQGNNFKEGDLLVQNRQELNAANPRYIHVTSHSSAKGQQGITNEGFRGMGIKKGVGYDFSVLYRLQKPGVKLNIDLVDSTGKVLGSASLIPAANQNKDWKKQSVSFTANATEPKARLNIWFEGTGVIDLDMISLFPKDTWKNRPGGMRADMVQKLADLKPGFIRFPGGCIVEGRDLANRYQWKKTIGPVEERHLIMNRWNTEFAHRPTPDYYQTFGLGFFEYFQLAEDIGAEPLPILNAGMACQFNTAEVVPMDEIGPYVQDALDLIEFANGNTSTKWGKVRARMGHPAPFNLKMLGVGNENWGPQYVERLQAFTKAIKAKYPDIKLDYSSGTDPNGDRFDYLNNYLRKMKADVIDEHYYRRPEWFLANAKRYDNYDRNGSKIFAGEYAAQSDHTVSVNNKNNWETAIAEAAFMTGMERNAAVVHMASYAPLFAHIEGWQWTPDLIWVDNLRSYGTPNYYVQKLFSNYKGTDVVSISMSNEEIAGQDSLYASAAIDKKSNEVIIKVVNASDKQKNTTFSIEGAEKLAGQGSLTLLKGDSLQAVNSLENPTAVSPVTKPVELKGKNLNISLEPYSFSVIRVSTK